MDNIEIDRQKLLYFMNLRKITPMFMCEKIGLLIDQISGQPILIKKSDADKISAFLNIAQDDLVTAKLPHFIYQSHNELYSSKRPIYRDGMHFYNYYSLPSPKGFVSPVILDILCPENVIPQLNNGHFEEAITVNLGPGSIYGRWGDDVNNPTAFSIMHANDGDESWILGDSYFEPSYCRHSYSLVNNKKPARILSYTAYNDLAEFKKSAISSSDFVKNNLYNNFYSSDAIGVVKKYLSAQMKSMEDLCNDVKITSSDLSSLGHSSISTSLVKKIADYLKIDPRLLLNGSGGGDALGKEYCSLSESREKIRKFGEYVVAPIASSSRTPDLKGSFVKLDNVVNGSDLILGHNVHYLVTSGKIYFVPDIPACLPNSHQLQEMTKDDTLWVAAGVKHKFIGTGSYLMVTNGQGGSYLNHYALQNVWDSNVLLERLKAEETDWGYEKATK